MLIRFQGKVQNERASSFLGIFQLAFQLRDGENLEKHFEQELLKNIQWLKEYLKSPKELDHEQNFRAISWFKPEAKEPIKRIRALVSILQEHGYAIDTIKTKDPGNIIYEDGWQIVAKPRKA